MDIFLFIIHTQVKTVLGAHTDNKHFKLRKKQFVDSFVQCPEQT